MINVASPVLGTASSYDCVKCFRVLWEDWDLEQILQQFPLIKAWLTKDPLSLSFKMSFLISSSLQSSVGVWSVSHLSGQHCSWHQWFRDLQLPSNSHHRGDITMCRDGQGSTAGTRQNRENPGKETQRNIKKDYSRRDGWGWWYCQQNGSGTSLEHWGTFLWTSQGTQMEGFVWYLKQVSQCGREVAQRNSVLLLPRVANGAESNMEERRYFWSPSALF